MILLHGLFFLSFIISGIIIIQITPSTNYDPEACEWVCSLHGAFTNKENQCPICYQPINYLEYL